MTTDKLIGHIKRLEPYSDYTQRHAIQLGRNFMVEDMSFLHYGIMFYFLPALAMMSLALGGLLLISAEPIHFAGIMLVAVWVARKVERFFYIKMVSEGVDVYFEDYAFLLHGNPPISRSVINTFD